MKLVFLKIAFFSIFVFHAFEVEGFNTTTQSCACFYRKSSGEVSCPSKWPTLAPTSQRLKCMVGGGFDQELVSTMAEFYEKTDTAYGDDDAAFDPGYLNARFEWCTTSTLLIDGVTEYFPQAIPKYTNGFSTTIGSTLDGLCDYLTAAEVFQEFCVCNTDNCNRECPIDERGFADESVCVSEEADRIRDQCPAPRQPDGAVVLVATVAAIQATAGAAAIAVTFAGSSGSAAASGGGAAGATSAAGTGGGGASASCVGTCTFRGRELCGDADCTQNINRNFPRLHHYRRSLFRNRAIWYGATDDENFLLSLFRNIPLLQIFSLHVAYVLKGDKPLGNQWLTSPLLCPCRLCHDVRPTLGQGLLDMDLMLSGYKAVTAIGLRMAFSMGVADLTAGGAIGYSISASVITTLLWRILVLPYTHDCAARWTEKGRYRTSVGMGVALQLMSTVLVAVGSATGYEIPPLPNLAGFIFDLIISPFLAFLAWYSVRFFVLDSRSNATDASKRREVPSYEGLVELYGAKSEEDVEQIGQKIRPLQKDIQPNPAHDEELGIDSSSYMLATASRASIHPSDANLGAEVQKLQKDVKTLQKQVGLLLAHTKIDVTDLDDDEEDEDHGSSPDKDDEKDAEVNQDSADKVDEVQASEAPLPSSSEEEPPKNNEENNTATEQAAEDDTKKRDERKDEPEVEEDKSEGKPPTEEV